MSKSRTSLMHEFANRSVEASRNEVRALKADKEGDNQAATLFRALANAQHVQAAKALMLLRGIIHSTNQNLDAALAETQNASDRLHAMVMTAATDREAAIESCSIQFMKATASHTAMLEQFSSNSRRYHVCQICGHITGENIPERCPVCRAVPEQFVAIE